MPDHEMSRPPRTIAPDNKIGACIISFFRGYHHKRYWKLRAIVTDSSNKTPTWLKLLYFLYIKIADARNGCSFGTNLNSGTYFKTPPLLPHGPNGIIVGYDLCIGANCEILQQVTIAHGGGTIGDNVMLGAGSKVLAGVHIGNNVKVGMNAVVVEDVPDNCTVVLPKPRIIHREMH